MIEIKKQIGELFVTILIKKFDWSLKKLSRA